MPLALPPDIAVERIHGAFTKVTSRVDIYESDAATLWLGNAPVISGSVSISSTRDERRTASCILENVDGVLAPDPDGFWYDKVIKLYRGITHDTGAWETQLGEFYIDTINQPHFPHTVEITARDATKKLLLAKFATSTTFPINQPIEEVIRTIAINGGIPSSKISFPLTGKSTGREWLFDRMTERWKAMSEIATAYGYDLWFRGDGVLTMDVFKDPANAAVSPAEYRFETGPGSNRVPNHSFETGLSGDTTRAAAWSYNYENAGSTWSYARPADPSPQPFKGKYSLAIINNAGDGSSVASNSIPVVAGEVWNFKYAARATPATSAGRYFRVIFHTQADGTRSGTGFVSYTDMGGSNQPFNGDWVEYTGQVTVPNTATHMRVVVYAWAIAGVAYTAYFDNISAVKASPLDPNQGNLAGYSRSTADARLYNHVVVTGESADTVPVTAQAENNNATSPTRIARIGRRTFFYTSAFISTQAQAQEVADRLLKTRALEQFEVSVEAIVAPYLDAGIIVEFIDPEPTSAKPIRFLLTEVDIPLELSTMTANAKRVTLVT